MWRIAASMGLMFGAVAWSALALVIIFLVVPFLWESLFGPTGGAIAALVALALVVWGSARVMHVADRLIGEPDHRRGRPPPAAAAAPDTAADWHDYTAEIVRSKRWAFYRRTRQFDRLAELEAEGKQAKAKPQVPADAR